MDASAACVPTLAGEDDHPFAWWALIAAASVTMLLWGGNRRLDAQRRQRQRELEETMARRTAELIRSKAQLEDMAFRDPLTGLPNRSQFQVHLRQMLHDQKQGDGSFAMVLIKIDALRRINELHGHTIGDATLKVVGELLATLVRTSDLACHLNGNEFAVLIGKVNDPRTIDTICARILTRLHEPQWVSGRQVQLDAHVGVVPSPGSGASPDDVLNAADSAVAEARSSGSNTWRWGVADRFTFTA
jgi:diguanylate cyclase (GGDEF)-like protein